MNFTAVELSLIDCPFYRAHSSQDDQLVSNFFHPVINTIKGAESPHSTNVAFQIQANGDIVEILINRY